MEDNNLKKRGWIRKAFICAFLIACTFFLSLQGKKLPDSYLGKNVSEILSVMPKSDREKLEYFFRHLVQWGCFGYVLCGDKPMAFEIVEDGINPFESWDDFRLYFIPRRIKYVNGWKTWKKYEKFFPMSRYAFYYERHRSNNTMISLVNKDLFSKKVREHIDDFEEVLGEGVEAEELLEKGLKCPLIFEALKDHDLLIGILLGYGRENAWLFYQRSHLDLDESIAFSEEHQLGSIWDEEFEEFRKLFEPVSWVSTYITGAHLKDIKFTALPGFAAVDSSETLELKKKYLETREAIKAYYKDKDFLEATLQALTS